MIRNIALTILAAGVLVLGVFEAGNKEFIEDDQAQAALIFQDVVRTITEHLTREVAVQCPECPRALDRCMLNTTSPDDAGIATLTFQCQGFFAPCRVAAVKNVADPRVSEEKDLVARGIDGEGIFKVSIGISPAVTYKIFDRSNTQCGYTVAHSSATQSGSAAIVITPATWTQIGGDGLDSSWTGSDYDTVSSLASYSGSLYAGIGFGADDGEVWKFDGTSWTQVGGDSLNSSWGTGIDEVHALEVFGSNLYAGTGNTTGDAEVWEYNGSTWTKVGGDSVNSSWSSAAHERVFSLLSHNSNLYAGLAIGTGDAEVWEYDGVTWTKVGGDGVNSSWADATYEQVPSLAEFDSKLYAGLGVTTGDAEVWEYDGATWTKIGGDSVNSSWDGTTQEYVLALAAHNSKLYAGGLGTAASDAEVWEYDGSSWTKIGDTTLVSDWANKGAIGGLISFNGALYAGTTGSTGDGEVWKYDGSSWTLFGGQEVSASWAAEQHKANEFVVHNSQLYVGISLPAGSVEVWKAP